VIKVGDNISTDTIMPAGSKVLPLRSNIEAISEFVFYQIDPKFYEASKEAGSVVVVGGENYGQVRAESMRPWRRDIWGSERRSPRALQEFTRPTCATSGSCPWFSKTPKTMIVSAEGLASSFPESASALQKGKGKFLWR